jgi:hypothetical protein
MFARATRESRAGANLDNRADGRDPARCLGWVGLVPGWSLLGECEPLDAAAGGAEKLNINQNKKRMSEYEQLENECMRLAAARDNGITASEMILNDRIRQAIDIHSMDIFNAAIDILREELAIIAAEELKP